MAVAGAAGCSGVDVEKGELEDVDNIQQDWTNGGFVDNATTTAPIGATVRFGFSATFIYGGTTYTRGGNCTGTLVEDRTTILTAAHCLCAKDDATGSITGTPNGFFGEDPSYAVITVDLPQDGFSTTYSPPNLPGPNPNIQSMYGLCPGPGQTWLDHAKDLAVVTLDNPIPANLVDAPVPVFVGNVGKLINDGKWPSASNPSGFTTAGYNGGTRLNRTVVTGAAATTTNPPVDVGDPSIAFTTDDGAGTQGGDSGGALFGVVPGFGPAYAFGTNSISTCSSGDTPCSNPGTTNWYAPMGSIDATLSTRDDERSQFIRGALDLPTPVGQIFGGSVALYGAGGVNVGDRSEVDSFTGGGTIVGGRVEIGSLAQTQAINSDFVWLRSNMATGNVITNTFSVQSGGTVGRFMPYEDIEIQQDPYIIVNPVLQQARNVIRYNGAPPIELSPGAYGKFNMHSSVTLRSGTYSFDEFLLEPSGAVFFDASSGPIRIAIRGNFTIRGTLRAETINPGDLTSGRLGLADSVLWVHGGSSAAVIERPFTGSLISSAQIILDHDDNPHFGALFSLSSDPSAVLLRPDQKFTHVAFDGDYGFELPQPPVPEPGDFTAIFTDNAEWGTGYCKNIQATNNAVIESSDWEVEFDLQGSEIYLTWNGIFSGDTGIVTARPAQWWNQQVAGLNSDSTVGFCARRASGSSADPIMLSASGEY